MRACVRTCVRVCICVCVCVCMCVCVCVCVCLPFAMMYNCGMGSTSLFGRASIEVGESTKHLPMQIKLCFECFRKWWELVYLNKLQLCTCQLYIV